MAITLSPLFSDGAVFQRSREIRVFGEGVGSVTAEFLGETRTITADGPFEIDFSAHPAGGPHEMRLFFDGKETVLHDLMIGEVFFVSGQSNSALTIGETFDRDTVFPSDPNIRYFMTRRPGVDALPLMRRAEALFSEHWSPLRTEEAVSWSAIPLHIARYYAQTLHVPIGILQCDKWGTKIRSFLSEESNALFREETDAYAASMSPEHRNAYLHPAPDHFWNAESFLYHFMLSRCFPYPFRAAIWYQGESDCGEDAYHDRMLVRMIEEWREQFRDPSMLFAVIGINDYNARGHAASSALRAAQKRASEQTENCVFADISDLGEWDQIHPRNKREVCARVCEALDPLLLAAIWKEENK